VSSARIGIREVGRRIGGRFREGWRALPPDARRGWQLWTAGGAILLVALMAGLVFGVRAIFDAGGLAWEPDVLRWVGANGPFSFSYAVWFQTFGGDPTLIILTLTTAGILAWMRRPISALSVILAYVGMDLVVRVGWSMWARARPDIIHGGIASPSLHAFPSGHTGKTLAVYGLLIGMWIRSAPGWIEKLVALLLLGFLAAVVPLGRLTMGVHWPSDLLGGYTIGLAWLIVLTVGLRYERQAIADR
jgi:undecaprenyl-diphosphatase